MTIQYHICPECKRVYSTQSQSLTVWCLGQDGQFSFFPPEVEGSTEHWVKMEPVAVIAVPVEDLEQADRDLAEGRTVSFGEAMRGMITDRTVKRAWDAFALGRYQLTGTNPTDDELVGMRAAIEAALLEEDK